MPRRNEKARKRHRGRSGNAQREALAFMGRDAYLFAFSRRKSWHKRKRKEPSDQAA